MKKLLALIFLTAFSALAWAGEPSFSSMEEGDRIEMTFHSEGCFHNKTSYYEVAKKNGSCVFTEYAITWHAFKPGEITAKTATGVVELTPKDLTGLDGLMKFFRSKKTGGSTTWQTLVVEYYEGGKRIAVENLEDGTGGYGLDKKPDVTTFYDLTARLKNPVK